MLKLERFSCSQKILFKWDPPVLIFSYHWETLHEPHCEQCWVKLTHASHVILQLILYKLWSKTLLANSDSHTKKFYYIYHCYKLSNSIRQFWHHSYVQLKELPREMVSHILPYL